MFANLFPFSTRNARPHGDAFVLEVNRVKRVPRDPKIERMFLICWVLIAIKHVAIIWAANRYPIPFHQLWINFPTWLLGLLATVIYYGRTARR